MYHFAYPNVIPREDKFIGCGRYAALLYKNECPSSGYKPASPNTPNLRSLKYTVQIVAPESFDSENIIYESKDQTDQKYRGNSLDLAYLLAHVSRSRSIALPRTEKAGDIWCTGAIDTRKDIPQLLGVNDKGFDIKLKAFLSEENHDWLFIVPTENIRVPDHAHLFEKKDIRVLSLREFHALAPEDIFEKKTILKVLSNEIELLIRTFFKNPEEARKPSFIRRSFPKLAAGIFIGLAVLIGVSYYYWPRHQGQTSLSQPPSVMEIREMLKTLGGNQDPEFFQLWTNKPDYSVGDPVSYHFQSDQDYYAVVLNLTSGGDLIQLFPSQYHPNPFVQTKKAYAISMLTITGPPGEEEILALLSESYFEIMPIEWAMLEGSRDDPMLLRKIRDNIETAKELSLLQKRIRYLISDAKNQREIP